MTAPEGQPDIRHQSPLLLGAQIYMLVLLAIGAATLMAHSNPELLEIQEPPFWENYLYNPHDESIMLLIFLGIIPVIAANYGHLREVPDAGLLLTSFGCMVGSAVLTGAEGFFLPALLNWGEHLLLAGSSILLAIWCGRMAFGIRQEDS